MTVVDTYAVPNRQPSVDPGAVRLAVIGESPGISEASWWRCPAGHHYARWAWEGGVRVHRTQCGMCCRPGGEPDPSPFVGPSGMLLNEVLAGAGTSRAQVFVGNVAQYELGSELDSGLVADGMARLRADLAAFRPNVLLLLGGIALTAWHPNPDPRTTLISNWRGSIFAAADGTKCVAAFHPAAVLRQPDWLPYLRFDVRRAVVEAASPVLDLPQRVLDLLPEPETVAWLNAARGRRAHLAHDIEGWPQTGVSLMSFADSATHALSVPLRRLDGSAWWSPAAEGRILHAVKGLLEDADVPKICHNAAYEAFTWRWAHDVRMRGVAEDTMMLWHETYPEAQKALDVAASIATREPYWKHLYDVKDDAVHARYNGIDSMVTFELWERLTAQLSEAQLAHYRFNVGLLEPTVEQMVLGLRYDGAARERLVASIQADVYGEQGRLDTLAGIAPPTLAEVAAKVCFKRKLASVTTWDDVVACAKPTWRM